METINNVESSWNRERGSDELSSYVLGKLALLSEVVL